MNKLAYIGVPTEVPIYEKTEISINGNNINNYFQTNIAVYDKNGVEHNPSSLNFIWNEDYDGFVTPSDYKVESSFVLVALSNIYTLSFDFETNENHSFAIYNNKLDNILEYGAETNGSVTCSLSKGDWIYIGLYKEFDDESTSYHGIIDNIIIETDVQVNTEIKEVTRHISNIYIGVPTEFPIYEGQSDISITDDNLHTYFTIINNSPYYFDWYGGNFVSNNQYLDNLDTDDPDQDQYSLRSVNTLVIANSTTAATILTALTDITALTFDYIVSSEEGYDNFYVTAGYDTNDPFNNTVLLSTSGEVSSSFSTSLKTGESLCFIYAKDSSVDEGNDQVIISNIVINKQILVGTYTQSIARKVVEVYIGVNGVARPLRFDMEYKLQDFEYVKNSDNIYILTSWKETLNGEPSTKLVVPNYNNIIMSNQEV